MNNRLIVKSETTKNALFRPGDWVERLASCCASFTDDKRLKYQNSLKPIFFDNEKCLAIDFELEHKQPEMWNFVMSFVLSNKLKTFITVAHEDETTVRFAKFYLEQNEAA